MNKAIIFNRPTAHDCVIYNAEQLVGVPSQISESNAAVLVQRGVARFADPDLMVLPAATIQKKTTPPDSIASSLSPADRALPPTTSKPSNDGTAKPRKGRPRKSAA